MILDTLIAIALLALVIGSLLGKWMPRCWLALTMIGALALLTAACSTLTTGSEWHWRGDLSVGGDQVHLRLDVLSAWFLVLVAVASGAGAAYAQGYWPDRGQPESAGRGRAWWNMLVLGMALVLLCANGLHFLMAWEIFAVSAYFLITLDRDSTETRAAGWLYLAASHAGTMGLFAFFSSLATKTGTWELGPVHSQSALAPLFWLALFGFGVKAGLFPLHVWLPSAHANAPSHVSALMSGVAIKMGLYGIIRFGGWLPLPTGAGWAVLILGAVSAVLGATFAVAQNDLKRLLAYCSVENVGVILIALGVALLGMSHGSASWGRIALAGALLHVWNHGAFKMLLFLGAGSVVHATGTRDMSRMGGLWRAMPWTAALFGLGSAAISALPPLNGFVSEWLVYLSLLDAATGHADVAAAAVAAALALALAGGLALATSVKASAMVFLGSPRTSRLAGAHECGGWMRVPMVILACLCMLIAMFPWSLWTWLRQPLGLWHISWGALEAPAPLVTLGVANMGVLLSLSAGALLLHRRAKLNGLARGLTWDCGYAAPVPRMQYTAGSFARIIHGWFGFVLQPERRLRRPRGAFPHQADHLERIPETVLEHIVGPLSDRVMLLSAWVRQRQHGHLPDYILYLVVALAAMGTLVLW